MPTGVYIRKQWHRDKISKAMKGERSPFWKGDNVGYYALHAWIKSRLGSPTTCQFCEKTGLTGHKIHWANISGEYRRDLVDWIRLCVKCHSKYDASKGRGWKLIMRKKQ